MENCLTQIYRCTLWHNKDVQDLKTQSYVHDQQLQHSLGSLHVPPHSPCQSQTCPVPHCPDSRALADPARYSSFLHPARTRISLDACNARAPIGSMNAASASSSTIGSRDGTTLTEPRRLRTELQRPTRQRSRRISYSDRRSQEAFASAVRTCLPSDEEIRVPFRSSLTHVATEHTHDTVPRHFRSRPRQGVETVLEVVTDRVHDRVVNCAPRRLLASPLIDRQVGTRCCAPNVEPQMTPPTSLPIDAVQGPPKLERRTVERVLGRRGEDMLAIS